MSIRARLLLLVLGVAVPALTLVGAAVYSAFQSERRIVELHLRETTRALALAVDRELGKAEAALRVLSHSHYLAAGDLAAFHQQARAALGEADQWIVLTDASGQQLVNTRSDYGAPLPQSSAVEFVRRVAETRQSAVSGVLRGKIVQQWVIGLAVPVIHREQITYVLSMVMLPSAFTRVLADQNLPATWIGSILDQSGIHVARTHQPDRFIGHPAAPGLLAASRTASEGLLEQNTLEGIPVLAAFSRSPVYGWTFAMGVPTAELWASVRRSLEWILALAVGLIGASVLLAIAMARQITTPIRSLAMNATALGRGEDISPPPPGIAEIDAVGRALVEAAGRLRRRDEERSAAAARQTLLINELNHRVKNTLAAVQSLAWQTLRAGRSPEEAREAFEARLMALSSTHNLLTRESWEGAFLKDVLEAEFAPHRGGERDRFVLDGEPVRLTPQAALALGLIFHELTTNALKYGALSTPSGYVDVSWRTHSNSEGRQLCLVWKETSGPPVQQPTRKGFGSRLVGRSIAHELRGQVLVDFEPTGLRCEMRIPCDSLNGKDDRPSRGAGHA